MTGEGIAILIGVMLVLAALPSASVALVVARAATGGFRNGAAVSAGIVLGDLIFVVMAVLGMSALAEAMGSFFAVLRYVGAAYLIWMGVGLLRSLRKEASLTTTAPAKGGVLASFTAGLLLTLGDVKAILFYASLFPAVVDMHTLTLTGVLWVMAVTIVTVGGVKLLYAWAARRLVNRFGASRYARAGRGLAGGLMVGTGGWLILKS